MFGQKLSAALAGSCVVVSEVIGSKLLGVFEDIQGFATERQLSSIEDSFLQLAELLRSEFPAGCIDCPPATAIVEDLTFVIQDEDEVAPEEPEENEESELGLIDHPVVEAPVVEAPVVEAPVVEAKPKKKR